MDTNDLEQLENSVRFYESQVATAQEAVEQMQTQLAGARRDLEIAQNFLDLERRRFASSRPLPFENLNLRDACVMVVRQKGRATIPEIVEALQKGGVTFLTEYPSRAVHAALIRASDVRKVGPGTYEVVEGRML